MARIKKGVTAHARHKKILKQAKGFYGTKKKCIQGGEYCRDESTQRGQRDRKSVV